jgi:hypothetical protein
MVDLTPPRHIPTLPTFAFHRGPANGRNRRVSPIASGRSDGPLSDHRAGGQPAQRELVFMPLTGHSPGDKDRLDEAKFCHLFYTTEVPGGRLRAHLPWALTAAPPPGTSTLKATGCVNPFRASAPISSSTIVSSTATATRWATRICPSLASSQRGGKIAYRANRGVARALSETDLA